MANYNYFYLNKFNKIGDLCLSKKVFVSLGLHALDSVKEVIKRTNKKGINLNDEVSVSIKDNHVIYRFNVDVEKGVDVENVKDSIKNIVTTDLLIHCDPVPFQIETKVNVKN